MIILRMCDGHYGKKKESAAALEYDTCCCLEAEALSLWVNQISFVRAESKAIELQGWCNIGKAEQVGGRELGIYFEVQ